MERGVFQNGGYTLRLARLEDAEEYFRQNFDPLDPEVARLTGCKACFSQEEVVDFFLKCVASEDRYDFLLIAPDGRIVGESVINEIDWELRCANFRVAIFHPEDRGKGLGTWAVETVRDFAFERLKLHRLELDVFSFNPQAEKTYLRAGFRREGVLRDAIRDGDRYADDILMAILEDEWRILRHEQN
ncbi:MAG: GNAT family N-acetyltransferase [Faecousia sp.]